MSYLSKSNLKDDVSLLLESEYTIVEIKSSRGLALLFDDMPAIEMLIYLLNCNLFYLYHIVTTCYIIALWELKDDE